MPYDALGNRPNRTRVLFVSSEIYPLAKSGGLADVSGALPRFIAAAGEIDIILMLPGYPTALELLENQVSLLRLQDLPGGDATLILGDLPGSDLRVLVVDNPDLFYRPGLYTDENGLDWPDNAIRFAALCHAACRVAIGDAVPHWRADVVHCNDWHTGLIPMLLAAHPCPRPKTVMTIHNLAFQGNFPGAFLDELALPAGQYSSENLEFYGNLSFLKSGILHADSLTTVSPSYAEEILGDEFGMGFEGVLRARQSDLVGILNGIDTDAWNPGQDCLIPARYGIDHMAGKARCKASLQADWGLAVDPDATLIIFLARLELQKMADCLIDILPELMSRPKLQLAVLGAGTPEIEAALADWPRRATGRVAVHIGYDEELAHQLIAAGDILLHGSRFEPCGLTPLYALRYGTIPIVNQVGGLRDTTIGATAETLDAGIANAVHFVERSSAAMLAAVDQAVALRADSGTWHRLQSAAMAADFSWHKPAAAYGKIYEGLVVPRQFAPV